MQKICAFLLIVYIFIGTHKLLHDATGNFRPNKIPLSLAEEEKIPLASDEKNQFFSICNQKFHYLAKGHHIYAFESEDGKYILKFPRHHKFFTHFWLRLPILSESVRNRKMQVKTRHWSTIYNGHKKAFHDLQNETGVIYVHLSKTKDLNRTVTLVDAFKREFTIDLDEAGYILQKRFSIYNEEFREALKKKDTEEIKEMFKAYFEVIASRFSRGYINKDRRGWKANYAFVKPNLAYEIDMGSFAIAKNHSIEAYRFELKQCSRDYREWLEKNAVDYLELFDQELLKALEKDPEHHCLHREKKLEY